MQWFRKKSKKPILFMVVSDDNEWCRANLLDHDDVVIASKSAAHDMALLASSNHTIIDYGTFGQWGAMLSALRGGHMIVYNAAKHSNDIMAKHLKHVHLYDPKSKKIVKNYVGNL
jgi:galactoside 2-L-fucosyltransferase 1/2